MNKETKTTSTSSVQVCQNCKQDFVIEPEDFEFYEKIKVPPPTFCPDCRLQRRSIFRNERTLYKRKCDAPGHDEDIISIYHKDSPIKVYDQKYWWGDDWDPMTYGQDYDFSKQFFKQFEKLMKEVPRVSLVNVNAVNSDYVHFTTGSKNCYLIFMSGAANPNEDCLYGYRNDGCLNCVDSSFIFNSQECYDSSYVRNCNRVLWSKYVEGCLNSHFLYDCRNCQSCFNCMNLRNKSYCIFNKQYNEEDFKNKIKELDTGSYKNVLESKGKFADLILKFPHKYSNVIKSHNVTGDNITNSKNCFNSFYINESEDSKFIVFAPGGIKNSYDVLVGKGELLYDGWAILADSYQTAFSYVALSCRNVFYSIDCFSSSNLFGCIGLRHKEYCILNKQYSKEEYEELVPKIIEHMNDMSYEDKKGRIYKYGESFPAELSPFGYNETVAQEYFPLTKEQALEKGYTWKDPEKRDYEVTLKPEQLPDHIKDVKDDILEQVIGCEHEGKHNEQCTEAFKIIPQELEFYRKMNLPLPRLCPNCRYYQRIKQRNPLKLWHGKCMCAGEKSDPSNSSGQVIVYKNTIEHSHHGKDHCPNEFETIYNPDRKEIVYCEKCYQAEVV